MPEQIENTMVIDWWWKQRLKGIEERASEETERKSKEFGYREIRTNIFVPESDAYEYALEQCLNGAEQREFREMLIEWYYSGNWIKESRDAEKI